MRRTKIVATLGPASDPPEVLAALLDAGVDVVRLGLAHGTAAEHKARIDLVRDLARRRGRTVGVLADLPGPKVRTGPFPEGGAFLAAGNFGQFLLVLPEIGSVIAHRRFVSDSFAVARNTPTAAASTAGPAPVTHAEFMDLARALVAGPLAR